MGNYQTKVSKSNARMDSLGHSNRPERARESYFQSLAASKTSLKPDSLLLALKLFSLLKKKL